MKIKEKIKEINKTYKEAEKINSRTKTNKGITLIALIIIILVMLILAGVTLKLTLGEKGIIAKAQEAKDAQKISEYTERMETAKATVAVDNLGKVTLDDYIEQIYKEKIVPQGNITKISETEAKVVTEEGYEFKITAEKTEYIKKGEGNQGGGNTGRRQPRRRNTNTTPRNTRRRHSNTNKSKRMDKPRRNSNNTKQHRRKLHTTIQLQPRNMDTI